MSTILGRTKSFFAIALTAISLTMTTPAFAADPAPGGACTPNGLFARSGGAETSGVGHFLVCESSLWKSVMSFNGTGQITSIGGQTCNTDEILKFNGTVWACAAGAASSAGSPNQVIFNSGGALAGNDNFVFTSAGLLGLNTATPQGPIDIRGGTAPTDTNASDMFIVGQAATGGDGFDGGDIVMSLGQPTDFGAFGELSVTADGTGIGIIGYNSSNHGYLDIRQSNAWSTVRLNAIGAGYITPFLRVGPSLVDATYQLDVVNEGAGMQDLLRLRNEQTAANDTGAGLLFSANRTTSGLTNVAGVSGVITDITDGAYKGALVFSTANNAAPVERMRIDEAGNVGIGTTDPASALDVAGSARLFDTNAGINLTILNTDTTGAATYPNLNITNYAGATNGHPYIDLTNSRGSQGTQAANEAYDRLGSIVFNGGTGSGIAEGARIEAVAASTFSPGSTPTYLSFGTTDTSGGNVERMFINANGNVGIGDFDADHKLDVEGNIGMMAGGYLNWGDTDGVTGYGLRDNGGMIEFRSSTGTWAPLGGGGSSDLAGLTDTDTSGVSDGDCLVYNNSTSKWEPGACGSGGGEPCGGIGGLCADGSIYAGLSPDGRVPMYTTPDDAPEAAWGTSNTDTALANCTSGAESVCWTGESNTSTLAGFGAAYASSNYCNDLVAHGHSDWYLPSIIELTVLESNSGQIGGFALLGTIDYASSSEFNSTYYWSIRPKTMERRAGVSKASSIKVRCVRR